MAQEPIQQAQTTELNTTSSCWPSSRPRMNLEAIRAQTCTRSRSTDGAHRQLAFSPNPMVRAGSVFTRPNTLFGQLTITSDVSVTTTGALTACLLPNWNKNKKNSNSNDLKVR